jgi:hypothetical protein
MVVRGRNSLVATAAEGGTWVLTLQLARKRSLAEVKGLMAASEALSEAVARVRRQVSGGNGDESGADGGVAGSSGVATRVNGWRLQHWPASNSHMAVAEVSLAEQCPLPSTTTLNTTPPFPLPPSKQTRTC